MASITTTVTAAASRSRRRRTISFVVDPYVVTVLLDVPARAPGIRMQTFASRLETSIPAARSCTMSIIYSSHPVQRHHRLAVPGAAGRAGK